MEKMQLSLEEINCFKKYREQNILLFLTHKCPVGCYHCSVNAGIDSPSITDYTLFNSVLDSIISQEKVKLIGISGGEPFAEKKGLTMAMNRFKEVDKSVVIYTSGFWANRKIPNWIEKVLDQAQAIFLSVDSFHIDRIGDKTLMCAVDTIINSSARLIIQYIFTDSNRLIINRVINHIEKEYKSNKYDLNPIPFLTYGRGKDTSISDYKLKRSFSYKCPGIKSVTIKFDGTCYPCCHEQLISGERKNNFYEKKGINKEEITSILSSFYKNQILNTIDNFGMEFVLNHPKLYEIKNKSYDNICDLCENIYEKL